MNSRIYKLLPLVLTSLFLLGAGIEESFRGKGQQTSLITPGTYAASQVDTLYYNVEGTETGLRFWMNVGDSASITSVFLRRTINNKITAMVAGDTLSSAVVCRQDSTITGTISLTTLCQQYRIIVTYAATAQGVTTPTVAYGISKQY